MISMSMYGMLIYLCYKKQLELKTNEVKQVISRIGKLDNVKIHDTIGMENPCRYRNKAQFPIQNINGEASIGFYKKKSHDVIPTYKAKHIHRVNCPNLCGQYKNTPM